ncbi:MAG: mannose-6-phosphate isomerase, class I [Eubacteriaceae bacterium]
MYPLKFENLYYEKIWGGRDFEIFRNNLPKGNIGESWDIACHDNGMSVVSNGKFKGKTLRELIKEYGAELLGNQCKNEEFPLLVKLINSKDKLSVQVHPDDIYAKEYENENGKTEAWYVVDAKPGSYLIVGTKDCDKDIFAKAIEEGKTEEFLNKIQVEKGDCFLINSGLVHAICEGVVIAEIQQNSDITYRIYDYGRPREIHVKKSLEVINFDLNAINARNKSLEDYEGYSKVELCRSDYFIIEKYVVIDRLSEKSNEDKFFIFTCVEGEGTIITSKGNKESIFKGDSILIPASLGEYTINGEITLLRSYI